MDCLLSFGGSGLRGAVFLFTFVSSFFAASAGQVSVAQGFVFVDVAAPPGCEGVTPEVRLAGADAGVSSGLVKAVARVENPWCLELENIQIEAELVDSKGAVVARAASPGFSVNAREVVEKTLFFDAEEFSGDYSVRLSLTRVRRVSGSTVFFSVPGKSGAAGFFAVLAGFFRFL